MAGIMWVELEPRTCTGTANIYLRNSDRTYPFPSHLCHYKSINNASATRASVGGGIGISGPPRQEDTIPVTQGVIP